MLSIPIPEDTPHFDQVTSLEGVDYLLQVRYNQREACYTLSIGNPDGELYASGAKLVCSWPLFRDHIDPRMPPGRLIVMSGSNDRTPPALNELGIGRRCELYYVTEAELAEIAAL